MGNEAVLGKPLLVRPGFALPSGDCWIGIAILGLGVSASISAHVYVDLMKTIRGSFLK